MHVKPFTDQHIEDAAALVAQRYATLRRTVPSMPERYAQSAVFYPLLQDLTAHHTAVAALDGGTLVGFMGGMILPRFRGKRSAYSPEWANATTPDHPREIVERLYTVLADAWVSDRCEAHYLNVFAHDHTAIETLSWLGFGMLGVDAMRDSTPLQHNPSAAPVDIFPATLDDLDAVLRLDTDLHHYMQAAPIFLLADDVIDRAAWEGPLQNDDHCVLLARSNGDPIAFLHIGPANLDISVVIRDPHTASIYRAFTAEAYRAQGIATLLLNRALGWAQARGHVRCGVDFETMNILGSRFWLRHFQPSCYSLQRMIDTRLIPPTP
jgi:GNAT superfamily N-acetyltransferase